MQLKRKQGFNKKFVQHMKSPADTCVQSDGGYVRCGESVKII